MVRKEGYTENTFHVSSSIEGGGLENVSVYSVNPVPVKIFNGH